MKTTRLFQTGATLITVTAALALTGLSFLGFLAAADHDRKQNESILHRANFISYDDTIRDNLGNYLASALGNGTLSCATPHTQLETYFTATNPVLASPPGGYLPLYFKVVAPTVNSTSPPRCSEFWQNFYNTKNQVYFCLKIFNELQKIDGAPTETATVEVRLTPTNLIDDSPLTCAQYQAANAAPNLTTVYPGAKILYTIHPTETPDAVRTGLIVTTSIVNP